MIGLLYPRPKSDMPANIPQLIITKRLTKAIIVEMAVSSSSNGDKPNARTPS